MAIYGTLIAADAYHLARLNTAWAGTDAQKEAALQRASDWVDGQYEYRFSGIPTGGAAQERAWPRSGATDRNGEPLTGVPTRIEMATYEAALRELSAQGSLSPDFVASQTIVKEKIGAIEVQYADTASNGAMSVTPVVAVVENLLASILTDKRGYHVHLVV